MRLNSNQPSTNSSNENKSTANNTQEKNEELATGKQLEQLLTHISLKWSSLERTNLSILDLLEDPKLPNTSKENQNQKLKLYVNTLPDSTDNLNTIKSRLLHENPLGDLDRVDILELPPNRQFSHLKDHGTLYLPYPYVVPGGRFQEMYAWDSFFIALGLIRDNQVRLARNILDNYIYQIEHYGTILNGNRTYYLTRSQLPFLTPLIKLILPTIAPAHRQTWLRRAISAAESYHRYWTTGHHRVRSTGLSRFFDSGPPGSSPPEIVHETDPRNGSTAHQRVKKFFRKHYHHGIPDYDISKYYNYEKDELTPKFMDNDRAMRESGFDTSSRFGPFNSKILDFNPICLNSLIYLMEKEISELYTKLEGTTTTTKQNKKNKGNNKKKNSQIWLEKSKLRAKLIKEFNWDEETGLYFDYDYVKKERRKYKFGTTFIPLWTGLSSAEEAKRVAEGGMQALEIAGGISTSDNPVGGFQWDKPYVWAPLQLFAIDGLRKYGFDLLADRLAINFNSMVLKTWILSGHLWEKYNGLNRDQFVNLKFGYPTNEVGFGWTNALFTRFYDQLKAVGKESKILLLNGVPIPTTSSSLSSSTDTETINDMDNHEEKAEKVEKGKEKEDEKLKMTTSHQDDSSSLPMNQSINLDNDNKNQLVIPPSTTLNLDHLLHDDVDLLDWVQIGTYHPN